MQTPAHKTPISAITSAYHPWAAVHHTASAQFRDTEAWRDREETGKNSACLSVAGVAKCPLATSPWKIAGGAPLIHGFSRWPGWLILIGLTKYDEKGMDRIALAAARLL